MNSRIAVFSTADGLIGGQVISALLAQGVVPTAIILDGKPTHRRDVELHEQRTAGRIPFLPLETFELQRISTYFVCDHNNDATISLIRELQIEWIVNAGTPRILKNPVLSAPTGGILNCHPGLLPAFRGSSAVEWALYLDEPIGNTVHLMTEGIDEGPIFATERIPIRPGDTYQDIRVRVFEAGFALLTSVTRSLQTGRLKISEAKIQHEGRYFKPIASQQFAEVLSRLEKGAYRGATPLGASVVPAAV